MLNVDKPQVQLCIKCAHFVVAEPYPNEWEEWCGFPSVVTRSYVDGEVTGPSVASRRTGPTCKDYKVATSRQPRFWEWVFLHKKGFLLQLLAMATKGKGNDTR